MINKKIEFKDLGLIDYKEAWDHQEDLFKSSQDIKTANFSKEESQQELVPNHLLFCIHPHVYTLGKSGDQQNLLVAEHFLKTKGVDYYHINRGGDITYHGPGQLVAYPIIDLKNFDLSIKEYIWSLEEVIIKVLKDYNIEASRIDEATGVWLDTDKPTARKICAIGVKASRYVTMHGLAFNVNTDLNYYSYINPCGFTDKGVTSLQKELGHEVAMEEIYEKTLKYFKEVFSFE
ncbi:MAG: lipoyl(octanoyl) transferase LipB [Hyphomicrobiales bacterium]